VAATSSRHPGWALGGVFFALAIPLAVWASSQHERVRARAGKLAETVPQQARSEYVTSNKCEACHPSQYYSWQRGYHHTMTTYATPETVRGNFDNVRLSGGGYDVKLSRRGDEFFAEMIDPLWQYEVDFGQRAVSPGEQPPLVERRISLVTGSHHMQAYWVSSEVGNGQLSLPFTYLFDDRRWVPRGDVFLHPPESGRHQIQVWNVSCIRCHTTAGQPLALVGGKALTSRVGEMGIACEACHGPAEQHIAANQNPLRRYLLHLRGGGDPTIKNPARLPAREGSEVCGQCHSLTEVSEQIELGEGKTFVPGQQLEDSMPLIRPSHPTPALEHHIAEDPNYLRGYFWRDGTIRVSSRDWSGMIESRCMESGKLACTTCHSLHESDPDGLVADGAKGDGRCLGCHPAIGHALAAHTHHRADSPGSRCYNCHMPRTVYGLLKAIRNHRIDSPHVTDGTRGDERPNACNLCHVDRSRAWAAQTLAGWYHQAVPAVAEDGTPAAVEWLLSGDAVLRAIAAWHLGWDSARLASPNADAVPYLVAATADPYAAVRYVAIHALKKLDPDTDVDYLAPDDDRKRAGDAILRRWAERHPQADLAAIQARITRLIEQRDETPVRAME
jgi:predicted CXXCH cytochrome family protein